MVLISGRKPKKPNTRKKILGKEIYEHGWENEDIVAIKGETYVVDSREDEPEKKIVIGIAEAFNINPYDFRIRKIGITTAREKQNDLKHQKETEKLREALKKIEKPEGAYSRDNLTFCENTIENMKELARKALKEE